MREYLIFNKKERITKWVQAQSFEAGCAELGWSIPDCEFVMARQPKPVKGGDKKNVSNNFHKRKDR